MVSLHSALRQYFGYSTFRPLQEDIISDIVAKKDVFILMPTGGGKSLCYQLPSVIQQGITIVISPLISLMKDQVDALVQNGIRAAYLNSSLLPNEQRLVLKRVENNDLSLLYVAPERLVQDSFLQKLKQSLSISSLLMKRIVFPNGDMISVLSIASSILLGNSFRISR